MGEGWRVRKRDTLIDEPWAKVPISLITDPGVKNGSALKVFLWLDFKAGKRGWWRTDQRAIADALEIAPATAKRAVQQLRDAGYIETERTGPRSGTVLVYYILSRSIPAHEVDVGTPDPPDGDASDLPEVASDETSASIISAPSASLQNVTTGIISDPSGRINFDPSLYKEPLPQTSPTEGAATGEVGGTLKEVGGTLEEVGGTLEEAALLPFEPEPDEFRARAVHEFADVVGGALAAGETVDALRACGKDGLSDVQISTLLVEFAGVTPGGRRAVFGHLAAAMDHRRAGEVKNGYAYTRNWVQKDARFLGRTSNGGKAGRDSRSLTPEPAGAPDRRDAAQPWG